MRYHQLRRARRKAFRFPVCWGVLVLLYALASDLLAAQPAGSGTTQQPHQTRTSRQVRQVQSHYKSKLRLIEVKGRQRVLALDWMPTPPPPRSVIPPLSLRMEFPDRIPACWRTAGFVSQQLVCHASREAIKQDQLSMVAGRWWFMHETQSNCSVRNGNLFRGSFFPPRKFALTLLAR